MIFSCHWKTLSRLCFFFFFYSVVLRVFYFVFGFNICTKLFQAVSMQYVLVCSRYYEEITASSNYWPPTHTHTHIRKEKKSKLSVISLSLIQKQFLLLLFCFPARLWLRNSMFSKLKLCVTYCPPRIHTRVFAHKTHTHKRLHPPTHVSTPARKEWL